MISKIEKAKGRRESGTFVAVPHACLNHPNYMRLSPRAVKLLFDLLVQFRGINNGDFSAAWTIMSKRGWKSRDQLFKARRELEDTGWIQLTRQGGRNRCSLYGVTFQAIDECNGKLDVSATVTALGWWKRTPALPAYSTKALTRHTGQYHPAIRVNDEQDWADCRSINPRAGPVKDGFAISVTRPWNSFLDITKGLLGIEELHEGLLKAIERLPVSMLKGSGPFSERCLPIGQDCFAAQPG